ncbi:MAG: zinc ribbon domain-containing protein, partial [Acidobacteriota bacterium]|nr:zinc ribbon domain-containing protein [Acidobacteriota bacterium]
MQCLQCQFENPETMRFCGQCGTKLGTSCPRCGAPGTPGFKFCGQCGASLTAPAGQDAIPPPAPAPPPPAPPHPPAAPAGTLPSYTPPHLAGHILQSRIALEGERKQVTVLFCDLVGSTALAARVGAETMHMLLNHFFELALSEIHRYEGTVNQFLGDGFMALFGAPIAHEDHARRAVLAASGLRRLLREHQPELARDHGVELAVRMGANTGWVVVGGIGDHLRMDYTA